MIANFDRIENMHGFVNLNENIQRGLALIRIGNMRIQN